LTTAAGLWATACMGLAVGIGFYKAAIVTCILISFATVILHKFDNFMLSKSKIMDIYMEFDHSISFSSILEAMKKLNIQIETIELVKPTYGATASVAAIMTIRLKQKKMKMDVLTNICSIEGVEFAEEI
jgi:Uncharacterized membrane protein